MAKFLNYSQNLKFWKAKYQHFLLTILPKVASLRFAHNQHYSHNTPQVILISYKSHHLDHLNFYPFKPLINGIAFLYACSL